MNGTATKPKPGRPALKATSPTNLVAMNVPADLRNKLIERANKNGRALGVEITLALKRGLR